MSPVAGCGHTVNLWCASPNVVCKTCFEAQGFVYNENSYTDIDKRAVRVIGGPSGLTSAERERLRGRRRRAAA